ncbi:hypothetical protein N7471_006107 [Penicillium samsonianum]|uniref:uncharacterized protein n=1 Tax=Penicillium samsonianum TaxID=1882272 RepID=UPI0025477556|nr:uncharacterized protein N7471_006107 [Penicillium samsonianum]KAJ6139621.1 hypothetical protein N7471_006107 [Penicillium samsonianum]
MARGRAVTKSAVPQQPSKVDAELARYTGNIEATNEYAKRVLADYSEGLAESIEFLDFSRVRSIPLNKTRRPQDGRVVKRQRLDPGQGSSKSRAILTTGTSTETWPRSVRSPTKHIRRVTRGVSDDFIMDCDEIDQISKDAERIRIVRGMLDAHARQIVHIAKDLADAETIYEARYDAFTSHLDARNNDIAKRALRSVLDKVRLRTPLENTQGPQQEEPILMSDDDQLTSWHSAQSARTEEQGDESS